ncbi:proline/glycine betaine transporter, Major facilitator superfamily [Cupriavidus taiwanensis LMG 19424]|uniref:Proline/glycine betaine transporter, Major facilitator superfamily n=3 Tax=Cupriavidus taiwanensis TaxID=164546 RepID=B3R7Y4_CUPTR|nr:proline/glycine betaine transporter, Major facilitator superfamily [Cupriavidus taiwanensis LMG 19424]SOY52914.1 proline/glycine betaine transporter, Major facilitator superfamily [Cupriavidus taiwanensis]SOY90003.1 proline/glycine betaine transporter, Major facilitator superfamily [Cupriavidus taiwanensis]SOZ00499.1 proline/glycine betaine transporter, Major facilitator superfamily [Cupriavidus taiwanensis]SOZ03601.1 proline/glycine betaine transporter, Major facilitator superfamily [Cupria
MAVSPHDQRFMTATTVPVPELTNATRRKAIIAATIGNGLEWFDFTVYSFFAVIIAKLFFPTGNDLTSFLLTVATFGVGFFMRPVGAIVLGVYADRVGRKAALTLTILLMALGTAIIGLAPTYDQIGLWAPALIVVARLIQGFSAGGEVGGATAFLIEHAPDAERGAYASWQQASQGISFMLGAAMGALVTNGLSPEQIDAWGWRIPFLFGLLIGPVGMYIRSHLHEPPEFEARQAARQAAKVKFSPLSQVLRDHPREVLAGLGVTILWTVCTYVLVFYMPSYAKQQLGLPLGATFQSTALCGAIILVLCPLMGMLSDRVGRKRMLGVVALLIGVLAYPLFHWLNVTPTTQTLLQVQIVLGILLAAFTGPAPAVLAEQFPTEVRSTGLSLAYNFAVTIFGGFAPLIVTWLIESTHNKLAPAYYVIAAAAVSFVALVFMHDRTGRKLA